MVTRVRFDSKAEVDEGNEEDAGRPLNGVAIRASSSASRSAAQ